MKHYALMLGLTIAVCLAACNKYPDYPHLQKRQITYLENPGNASNFLYDNNRLLTQILIRRPGPNFMFTNDAQGRPLTMKDSVAPSYDQFIYQHGKLVRIDKYGNGTSVTGQTLFTYDNKGRIIRKEGDANSYAYVTYEYEGNSCNFKRALYYNNSAKQAKAVETAGLIEEYTYDNEINPYNTLINHQVVPMHTSNYWFIVLYEPMTPNNVVNLKYYGRTDTGYFKFQEFNFTYEYDHHYPVSSVFKRTSFNNDGTPSGETTLPGLFRYEIFN